MSFLIDSNGNRLVYSAAGDPSLPPMLFVHGLMSHRGVWTRTIQHFQDRFYCIAIDLLGFGASDKPTNEDYSIQAQAERVLKVATHFGFETFSLSGHAMGGQIALHLAAKLAPERVTQLVSVAGVSTGELSKRATNFNMRLIEWGRNAPWLYRLSAKLSHRPWFARQFFKIWFFQPETIPFDAWKIDRDMALNAKVAEPAYQALQSLRQTNLSAYLPDICAPTLVIHGLQDDTVPVVNATLTKSRVRDVLLIIMDECGHFPMYEQFDTYIHYLEEFLCKG